MSVSSENMDFSPSRLSKVAACEKLRDTVNGISALHKSLHEESLRSPSPKNSYAELYRMSTQALVMQKEELVSELRTLPPCTRDDCKDHKIPTTPVVKETNSNESLNDNPKKKKLSKKRKNKSKESAGEFIFPKKTARPVSPNPAHAPVETSNHFSDLEKDVEQPLPTVSPASNENVTPKVALPPPVMLKIKKNYREQIKIINEKFPNIRNRSTGDIIKIHTNSCEERRALIHFMEEDKEFEFYVINRKTDKPLKVVIKGLPSSSKIVDVKNDLIELGFEIESCTQLISKRTKTLLPYFLVILPRNNKNSKIYDLTQLGYLQVNVEGYLVRGVTQCFNCNYFFHTAENCRMQPRCLKCGKGHATKNCDIKERQENPFCINCQDYGHSACYTKCPKFPKPRKGSPFSDPIKKRIFASKHTSEKTSFANIVSGETATENSNEVENKKESEIPLGFLSQDNNSSDLIQVFELFNVISQLVKKNPKILDLISKFKSANSDAEKTCLLAEALMNND